MTEQSFFDSLLVAWFCLAAAIFPLLFLIPAPYGRHARSGWGPTIEDRLGWLIMESPAVFVIAACFVLGEHRGTVAAIAFLAMWEAHYLHRDFIYPLGLERRGKRMPVFVVGAGFLFNVGNGYLNGRYLFTLSGGYPAEWLWGWRFLAGLGLFVAGYLMNRQADHTLLNLRRSSKSGYQIPQGGLYRWISCPNYLGEIIEWSGWALATWSLPGLAFAVWTAANLVPRAWVHHAWYRTHFPDYPPKRKALIPGLW